VIVRFLEIGVIVDGVNDVLDLADPHVNGRIIIVGCMKSIIAKLPAVEEVLPDSLYYFGNWHSPPGSMPMKLRFASSKVGPSQWFAVL